MPRNVRNTESNCQGWSIWKKNETINVKHVNNWSKTKKHTKNICKKIEQENENVMLHLSFQHLNLCIHLLLHLNLLLGSTTKQHQTVLLKEQQQLFQKVPSKKSRSFQAYLRLSYNFRLISRLISISSIQDDEVEKQRFFKREKTCSVRQKEGIHFRFSEIWRHELHNAQKKRTSLCWKRWKWCLSIQTKALFTVDIERNVINAEYRQYHNTDTEKSQYVGKCQYSLNLRINTHRCLENRWCPLWRLLLDTLLTLQTLLDPFGSDIKTRFHIPFYSFYLLLNLLSWMSYAKFIWCQI